MTLLDTFKLTLVIVHHAVLQLTIVFLIAVMLAALTNRRQQNALHVGIIPATMKAVCFVRQNIVKNLQIYLQTFSV
ncbi:hypothetical protein AGJ34_22200 [Cronobacter dublinensis subsp. dublinensis]|nr:hypothetical protein [Cronobacter dublinensis subsp. dublinensis]EGT5729745.1 hypothetical protein [Cronobacter dublinensis subsp. dublinensis]